MSAALPFLTFSIIAPYLLLGSRFPPIIYKMNLHLEILNQFVSNPDYAKLYVNIIIVKT